MSRVLERWEVIVSEY